MNQIDTENPPKKRSNLYTQAMCTVMVSTSAFVASSSSSAFDVMTVLNPQAGGC